MNPVFICVITLACAVLALAEPEPAGGFGGNGGGFGGQQGGFGRGNDGQSSYSRQQKQPSGLPYGAGANSGGGRFARSPEPQSFGGSNGGFGGSSYSQPQQQQSGLPYGANTPFGGQGSGRNRGLGGNNGGRFARSAEPQGFGGNNGGFVGSSYSQPQQQQSGLPYGTNTPFGGQGSGRIGGLGGNNGGRFARSPAAQDFGRKNGGFGGSSYSQPQQQQSGLPYGANTPFGGQGTGRNGGFGGNKSGRFARSPAAQDFGGSNGGFGGSSYSQPQQQQSGLPYGANTPFGGQVSGRNGGFGGNNGGRFARSPEAQGFGGSNGGFGGSSYSQPQQQQSGLPYDANSPFGGQGSGRNGGLGGNNGGRFARSPAAQDFGRSNGGFGGSSYSQPQQQQSGLPYGANTPFGGQGFGRNGGFGGSTNGFNGLQG